MCGPRPRSGRYVERQRAPDGAARGAIQEHGVRQGCAGCVEGQAKASRVPWADAGPGAANVPAFRREHVSARGKREISAGKGDGAATKALERDVESRATRMPVVT